MTKPVEDMTEAELAEYYYEHRDDLEGEDITEQVEVATPLAIQIAVRFNQDEASAIRKAAADAEVSVSEFIRNACRIVMDVPASQDGLMQRVEQLEQAVFDTKKTATKRTRVRGNVPQAMRSGTQMAGGTVSGSTKRKRTSTGNRKHK